MEALSAVGLAGNIVQFIDFTYTLFERATYIYHSQAGSTQEAQNVESITYKLQVLTVRLSQGISSSSRDQASEDEKALGTLANECKAAADELLSALQSIKAKKPGSKWHTFRAALASVWKEKQVDALGRKLHGYRSQLIIQLQVMQSDTQSETLKALTRLEDSSHGMSSVIADEMANLKRDVQETIKALEANLIEEVLRNVSMLGATWNVPSETIPASYDLLKSLTFDQMAFRHSKINDAHARTCDRAFSEKFIPWLESPEPIFWISGKPGSGKSTLMKYIVGNPELKNRMPKSVFASYFFWINGTEMQRSQEGLLQSLLHEILRQCPTKLIESILLPHFWNETKSAFTKGSSSQGRWTRAELLCALRNLATVNKTTGHLCVFVDGLDECQDNHGELIETIQDLARTNIKMCVASRPWNIFENGFGKSSVNKLYLHQVNEPDIQLYVKDKLRSNLDIGEVDTAEIMNEIVEKAQGVFLWVSLVVRSLLEGLINNDSMTLLKKRLRDFPSDLDEFFGQIFASLETIYHRRTARMFRVALTVRHPMSPLAYWFLDREEDKLDEKESGVAKVKDSRDEALSMRVKPIPEIELVRRTKQVETQINGRSKGLLEITNYEGRPYVDFLHRTAKDFLLTMETHKTLTTWQREDFDPHYTILKVSIASLKASNLMTTKYHRETVTNFLTSAKEYEMKEGVNVIAYIIELEWIMEHYTIYDSPLPFRDLCMSYDLALYIHARGSSGDSYWSFENTKMGWINHIGGSNTSLDMGCALLSFGPTIKIPTHIQDRMAQEIALRKHDSIATMVKRMCQNSFFEMDKRGNFTSDALNQQLQCKLSPAEFSELKKINRRTGSFGRRIFKRFH